MNFILNILWLILGGLLTCIGYMIASILMMITIIGIPFGIQTFKLAFLTLLPFGKEVRTTPSGGGCLNVIMNVLWLFLGGIWICLTHLAFGLLCGITIIGIPFALQHFKLAALALTPFGKQVVSK